MDITDYRKAEIDYKFNIIRKLDKKLEVLKQNISNNKNKLEQIEDLKNKIKELENNIYSQS